MKQTLLLSSLILPMLMGGTAQADDDYCREFQREVTIGGETEKSYGTACMQPDGRWKIQGTSAQRVDSAPPQKMVVQQTFKQPLFLEKGVYREHPRKGWKSHKIRHHPRYRHKFARPVSWSRHQHGYGSIWMGF